MAEKSISDQAHALAHSVGVRARDDLTVVGVAGEDARTWLNGQVTSDIRELANATGVYTLAVNVRGKIIADLWVLARGDRLRLLVPEAARQVLLDSFEHQIIMEDVELLTEQETRVVSVQGPLASQVIASGSALDAYVADELGHGGYLGLVARTELPNDFAQLVARAESLGGAAIAADGFELARLRAGRGRFGQDFGDQHYPQEAGLKERAVSFNKGCYLGQEVVCTLENRGRLTRTLMRLQATVAKDLKPLTELRDAEGKVAGQLTSIAHDPDTQGAIALGYVKRAHAEPGAQLHADAAVVQVIGPAG